MAENKIIFKEITEQDKQEVLANMRFFDYREFQDGKEGNKVSDMERLNGLINSCKYNFACYCGDDLLFCTGLRLNAFYGVLSVFWLLSTKKVEKHRIAHIKALKMLCKMYLDKSPQGLMCLILDEYKQAEKVAKLFNFKKIGEITLDKLKHFIYILIGEN